MPTGIGGGAGALRFGGNGDTSRDKACSGELDLRVPLTFSMFKPKLEARLAIVLASLPLDWGRGAISGDLGEEAAL